MRCYHGDDFQTKRFNQKVSLKHGRLKAINNYCNERGKSWTDLPLEEASELIEILVKRSWQ